MALRVTWLGIRWYITKEDEDLKPQEYVFFNTQLGNYAVCLLLAMAFITGAGIMGLPWLIGQGITLGRACTVQAFLNQVGTWSAGFFTVTIAIHTFNTLVLKRKQSLILSRSVMVIGWAISSLMASAPFFLPRADGDIYGDDGLMCGIRDIYPNYRFFLHLLPILVASVLSAVLYSVIYLVLRGTLKIHGGISLSLGPERWSASAEDVHYQKFVARVARSMIWYPVAYVALLVPYAVTRLLQISGFAVPFEALVFACTCWFMLGVVNVALLYNTFRVLGPAFDVRSQAATTRRDLESSALVEKPYTPIPGRFGSSRSPISPEKRAMPFHLPMAGYSSPESDRSHLPSSQSSLGRSDSYGATSIGGRRVLKSPKRSMDKAEVLAFTQHSPNSDSFHPRVRSPSFATTSPTYAHQMAGSGRPHHHPSSSIDSADSQNPFRPLERSASVVSSDSDIPTRYYGEALSSPSSSTAGRLPLRQLTLLASRSNSKRESPVPSREESPRSSFAQSPTITAQEAALWANPRTPPSPPSVISRIR